MCRGGAADHHGAMAGQKRTNPARRRVLRLAAAVVLAGAVAPALAACGHGPSDATTTLRGAAGVTVVGPDGRAHPAVDGEHLLVGDTVETTTARSSLLTGGRVTTLGPATTLDLAGRSRYVLAAGEVVVDHRHGPDAEVAAGPVGVDDLGRTAVRIERGFAVRVAVYDGGSARVTAGQGSATVPSLHELDVPGASLPAAPTPLALRDDALDVTAAPVLVAADRVLTGRATDLDRAGAVPAALVRMLPSAPPATPLSLRLLPVAIARADPSPGQGGVGPVYLRARQLRTDGGSWGVVAALIGAPVAGVQQQLDALLTRPGTGLALPAVAAGGGGAGAVAALLAAAAPPAAGSVPTAPAAGVPTPTPSIPQPVTVPTRAPVPPSPTPTPPVQSLLGTVLGLLPIGTPTPAPPTPGPTQPPPSSGGGLLGGVLGSLLGGG